MACDIVCAGVNQAALFTSILLVPLILIGLVSKLLSGLNIHGVAKVIFIGVSLIGCSLFGLVPWFITALVLAYAFYANNVRRNEGKQLNEPL